MKTLLWIFLGAATLAVLLVFLIVRISRRRKPYVIGELLANAAKLEQERLAQSPVLASPLPPGKYETTGEELDLLNPIFCELDARLRDACDHFQRIPEEDRSRYRNSISLDGFYTLLNFARRSSVFALRRKDVQLVEQALNSVAMIEAERTDFRDILLALGLLYHTAVRIGMNADEAFGRASAVAEHGVSNLIAGFMRRSSHDKELDNLCGLKEVDTPWGPGFVHWEYHEYDPTKDLLQTAIFLAEAVNRDKYLVTHVTLATEIPEIWLGPERRSEVQSILKRAAGCASLSALLKSESSDQAETQMLLIFVMELDTEAGAERLLRIANSSPSRGYDRMAVNIGRVFCLVIARSIVIDVASVESSESLRRFETPIREALMKA